MSYQDPNQQDPYGGYNPQPQPTDPYSGQQYGQQPGAGYQQPGGQQPGTGYQQPGTGYQQPNYNPYGQQQYSAPAGQTSMGLDQNVASGLAYVFMWLSGLIIFLVEKQNRAVRFHAMQSLIFFGGLSIITYIAGYLPFIGGIVVGLAWICIVVGWIVLMVNGFQGKYFKLPVIGDYAERYANSGGPRTL
ncbi:MAG: hypothetical protein J2P37_00620 [Ktedonobacteraceae bacterium]|nr:hypothetical protein [Ktedonobacteraceae bacterium]MBO0793862.1 hypothetical protein [Ktedonobacteraceae bacterium]